MEETAKAIIAHIEEIARSRGHDIKAMLVGSAARDTWLSGAHDLDIFLGVQPDGELEAALEVARLVAPVHVEKYAEHPYV
ncbi:MAG TPA: nucleotidyltransferase domain-containing protein, partial [Methanothrix sp.]|nr:nucleotidyltransferase domain-containing protein [Methanothrix sp.]